MKQLMRIAAASGLLLIAAGASAQVLNSPHDLRAATGASTTETCVFCHTPHGSDIAAPVPLWNKTLPAPGVYGQRYSTLNTSTLDGGETTVGSVSLACLSCHDGGQAMDSVINAPGRGTGPGGASPTNLGGGIVMPVGGINNNLARIGTDLRDDHPISIQYAGGGVAVSTHPVDTKLADRSPLFGDPDFVGPYRAEINTNSAWWVDNAAGTDFVRDKTDMILYTRTDAGLAGEPEPFVECGSCHDPHNSGSFVANQSVAFLRIPNTNSDICTSCHLK